MSILESYNKLKPRKLEVPTVQAHFPSPTEEDYERGFITRYFVQRRGNDSSPIFEITGTDFSSFKGSIFYKAVSLKWRISGPKDAIYDDSGFLLDKGVIASNRKSILLERETMPRLKSYLSNLTQFHKK